MMREKKDAFRILLEFEEPKSRLDDGHGCAQTSGWKAGQVPEKILPSVKCQQRTISGSRQAAGNCESLQTSRQPKEIRAAIKSSHVIRREWIRSQSPETLDSSSLSDRKMLISL